MRDQIPAKQRAHFSMLRNYQLADLLTLCNAASGTAAILATMSFLIMAENSKIYFALVCIGLALVFDIADGKMARGRHEQSLFGRELDSLADIVSFGVAPAVMAYALGMRGAIDGFILIYFVACGISRLARYNITAADLADERSKVRHFEGAPIPSSLILVAVLGICFHLGRTGDYLPFGAFRIASLQWHPLSILFLVNGSLMISKTLRVPKL